MSSWDCRKEGPAPMGQVRVRQRAPRRWASRPHPHHLDKGRDDDLTLDPLCSLGRAAARHAQAAIPHRQLDQLTGGRNRGGVSATGARGSRCIAALTGTRRTVAGECGPRPSRAAAAAQGSAGTQPGPCAWGVVQWLAATETSVGGGGGKAFAPALADLTLDVARVQEDAHHVDVELKVPHQSVIGRLRGPAPSPRAIGGGGRRHTICISGAQLNARPRPWR